MRNVSSVELTRDCEVIQIPAGDTATLPAGTAVELALFRRGWLTSVPVTPGTPPPEGFGFTPLATATPLERQIYESWLGAAWESPKTPTTEKPT